MGTFIKRTVSGVIYAALLIGCVLWCKYSFLLIMSFFVGVMMHEFMQMTMGKEYKWSQTEAIITGIVLFALVWTARAFPWFNSELIFIAIIPLFLVMINSLYVKDKSDFGKFANVYTSILYIAIPMSVNNFLVMDEFGSYNGLLLLCFFVIIWISDIGAYVFGMALGQKHGSKLFPSISPKKSWIGFWGGMLMAIVASLVMYYTGLWEYAGVNRFTWYHAIFLAVLMNVAGVYGDLFESQWKRHYDVKDSGNIIPGHGGLMDRLDSTIFAVPVGALYLSIFNLFSIIIQ